MTFEISRRHRWMLRFWTAVAAVIALGALFGPELHPSQKRGRLILAAIFTVAAGVLLADDLRKRRSITVDDDAIHLVDGGGRKITSIAWRDIQEIRDEPRQVYLYLTTVDGSRFVIEYAYADVEVLIREITNRTGLEIRRV